jgi:hypothetical protein
MIITIQEREFSWSSEYEIETPACIYLAQKKFFSMSGYIKLFAPRDRQEATIIRFFSVFRPQYEFDLADGSVYRFRCEKAWKGVYTCKSANELFLLYRHKGLNFSIFQNDVQIAAFTKNKITVGGGNQYEIRLNDDANHLLIICMTLVMDSSGFNDDSATLTYDFGNVGPEERLFDSSWEPS